MLIRELKQLAANYDDIEPQQLKKVLKESHLDSEEMLLQEIGLGNRMAKLIARQLTETTETGATKKKSNGKDKQPLVIKGTEGMVINFPKCCLPIPGDKILGFVTAGRGIVIHNQSCPNIGEYRNHPDKWINVIWETGLEGDFRAHITIDVTNQRGMLAKLASIIADENANIVHVEMKDRDDRYTSLHFIIEVKNRVHLARIMRKVRSIKNVTRIVRK